MESIGDKEKHHDLPSSKGDDFIKNHLIEAMSDTERVLPYKHYTQTTSV